MYSFYVYCFLIVVLFLFYMYMCLFVLHFVLKTIQVISLLFFPKYFSFFQNMLRTKNIIND